MLIDPKILALLGCMYCVVAGVIIGYRIGVSRAKRKAGVTEAENEQLKCELLDAKRDASRFEKAMYRAVMNWAHVRAFVYLKEHGASIDCKIPPQWQRAMDLCGLGYGFAKIKQDELPPKTKGPEEEMKAPEEGNRNCKNCLQCYKLEDKGTFYKVFCEQVGHWLEWNKEDNCTGFLSKD